jgi:hypothetical protein
MGWAEVPARDEREQPTSLWGTKDVTAAAAWSAVQLTVAGAVWLGLRAIGSDDHGVGPGLLALPCLLIFGPIVMATAGLVHSVIYTLPAVTAARAVARRSGGPEWRWHLLFIVAAGGLYAVPAAVLGASYPHAWAWTAASAVLPLLSIGYVRRREYKHGQPVTGISIWVWAAGAAFTLLVVAFILGSVAMRTGLLKEYEPPKLTASQLAGVWKGNGEDSGAVLRLDADGRAVLTDLPTEADDYFEDDTPTADRCNGTGRWSLDTTGYRDDIRLDMGDCDENVPWLIGGTKARPELSRFLGDPDSGDLRVLVKRP